MPTPPPVPPVADADRYVAYAPAGVSTTLVDVPFPVYGDASDLRVLADGNDLDPGSWSLISASGSPLGTLSQPITDGRIFFSPAIAPQTIEIYGAIHPRQLVMPTAPGIGRREFNQALGYILSALREAWTLAKLFRNQPLGFDAAGPLADRAQYDLEAAGFRFAVTDDASARPLLYVKLSDTAADWSQALNFRGATGATGPGGGTVTSVGSGFGLKGGPVTGSGTLAVDLTQFTVGLRNRLVNGGMAIDQRKAGGAHTLSTISGVTNYTVDRWAAYLSSSASGFTAQRQSVNAGGIGSALRLQRANGTTSTPTVNLLQVLETVDCIDLQGKKATLSFKARVGADFSGSGGVVNFSVIGGKGTDETSAAAAGGTWTSQATLGSSTGAPGTSFATYRVAVDVPSDVTQLAVRAWWVPTGTAGANDWIDLTDMQLEEGDIAAADIAPDRRPYGFELSRCQRFFRKSYGQSVALGANVGSAAGGVTEYVVNAACVPFHGPMRAAPALTLYDNLGASGKISLYNAGWTNAYTSFTTPTIKDDFFAFAFSLPGSALISFDYAATAEL